VDGTVSVPGETNRWASVGVAATCIMLTAAGFFGSLAYSRHEAAVTSARNERAFCALVGTLDSAYRAQPPTTATGKLVAAQVHDLYTEPAPHGLGCPRGR
jgi:hypothetical protein